MQNIHLTLDQENAAHEFAMFMASPDTEFTISGPAGVGKTTLLRYLRDSGASYKVAKLLDRPMVDEWVFTATTNKAAEVLGKALGAPASTIHSFLGLKVFNDYGTGKTKITRGRNSEVQYNKLIVIDECSMIDKQLRSYIQQCTMNCKILYVGDHCQMAPVMEEISEVFSTVQPAVINQIVRSQHTPAITNLCQQLRRTVETGVFEPIQGVPGIIDYLTPEQAEQEVREHFVDDSKNARIMCYTNSMAIQFNNWIRSMRGLTPEFQAGERVIACNTAQFEDRQGMTRIEQELMIEAVGNNEFEHFHVGNAFYDVLYTHYKTDAGTLKVCRDPALLQELLRITKKNADWPKHFALKEDFADLRAPYACTVYKAQGSTYETAFVHLSDIGNCTNASQAARMLYVACSRPTHRICFIGELPKRFQGN